MRPSALSPSDYMSLSGFNHSSTSPKTNTPLNYKSFGYYFNSPKSEAQKNLTYSTRLKNDSNRYSYKAERPLDTSVEKRNVKTRDYSATRTPGSLTYSGFYDSEKNYDDMKKSSVDLFKPGQTYTSGLRGTSASPLSRSTFIREATREDSNILSRKKYDVETSTPTQARNTSDLRPSSAKHVEHNSRWEDSTPKKGTVTYYPLEDFINKYSPTRSSNTTAAQNAKYVSEREKVETPIRSSLTQSRVMATTSTRPTSAAPNKYSMYESSVNTSPFSTTTPTKFNSYFDRQASDDVNSNNRTSGTSNFLNTYELKKYDYRETYDKTPTDNDKSLLSRNENAFRRTFSKTNDSDFYKRENEYRDSYANSRDTYESRERDSRANHTPTHNESNTKKTLDSFITRVDRNAMTQPFGKKFEEKEDYRSKYSTGKSSAYSQAEDRNYSTMARESAFKASHEVLNKEPKFYKTTDKSAYENELNYSSDVARWNGKSTRPSTARNDDSTDGSQEADSPLRPSSYTYYITDLVKNLKKYDTRDPFSSIYREHFQQSFQAMKFCRYMTPPDARALSKKKVYLPKKDAHKNRKTLIFDLDETLIHCVDSPMKRADVKLSIKFPTGEVIDAGINVRPHALEILKEMSQIFEVMVFTASHKSYANVVLDYLDPHKQYITHRLYRDSCIYTEEGVYVKDLRVIGNRNLQDMILVDNAAYSFGFQIENGVPCIPFYDNKSDQELKHLIPYLKKLSQARDIREVNKKTFKYAEYGRYSSPDELMKNVIFRD